MLQHVINMLEPGQEPHRLWRALVRAAVGGFATGIGVALLLYLLSTVMGPLPAQIALEGVMLLLWPSSFWLMALEGAHTTRDIVFVCAMSLGANGALYGLLFCIARLFLRFVRGR
jgi:hypothetical protein